MSRKLAFSVTLKDCEVQHFRCGGSGGQHRDKTSNGARIIHRPSGAVGECTENRSQSKNKEVAFKRMASHPKMTIWIQQQLHGTVDVEAEVDKEMEPRNLKVEIKDKGKWVEECRNPNQL